jgi:Protein of unknown function (DUF1569)
MNKNIFNPVVTNEIVSRINLVKQNQQPLWGKMNAAQMMAHCQMPLKVATGDAQLKRSILGFVVGKMMKKKFMQDEGFGKNLPTDKSFIMNDEKEFTTESINLIEQLSKFQHLNQDELEARPHPFFGKMNAEEWGTLSYKHLDHHLRQFGV